MAISNGFDETKVLAALSTRIGWRQSTEPEYALLDAGNQVADSQRYYNDFHPSVTIPNVYSAQENKSISQADFNTMLSQMKSGVIMNMVNNVFSEPQVIDRPQMYIEASTWSTLSEVGSSSSFVGYRLTIPKIGIAVQIHALWLMFNDDVSFDVKVYKELKADPVKIISVAAEANDYTKVDVSGLILNEGVYYIGYDQAELGAVKAIRTQGDRTCFYALGVEGISIPNTTVNGLAFRSAGISHNEYGLNFEASSYRDYTNDIVRNAHLFDELQGLQMAVQVVGQFVYSTRSNEKQRITEQQAAPLHADLNLAHPTQDMPLEPGLRAKLKKELIRVKKSFFPGKKITSTIPDHYAVFENKSSWNRQTYPAAATKHSR